MASLRISQKPSGMKRAVISLIGLFITVPECFPAAPDDAHEVPITVTGKLKVIQIDKHDDKDQLQKKVLDSDGPLLQHHLPKVISSTSLTDNWVECSPRTVGKHRCTGPAG